MGEQILNEQQLNEDMVAVTRCRNCKYRDKSNNVCSVAICGTGYRKVTLDGYCEYGCKDDKKNSRKR